MPIEFIQQSQPAGSSSDTLFRLLMKYDGTGRRISKTFLTKSATAASWDTVKVTHYTGIGTEVRESYRRAASPEVEVVVNMPQGLGRYGVEDAADAFRGVPLDENGKPTSWSALNPKFEWYLKNHLGSTMLVYGTQWADRENLADVGAPIAAYDYRSFGEQVTLAETADKVTENFTGKERDDETQLDYFGARYLDPMLGMWTSVDPARQFASPYLYAGNGMNPVNIIDPDGNAAYINIKGNDVTATVYVTFKGDAASDKNIQRYKKEVTEQLNGQYGRYNLTVKIVDFNPEIHKDKKNNVINLTKSANYKDCDGWSASCVTENFDEAYVYWKGGLHTWAHEFAHLLGLDDKYNRVYMDYVNNGKPLKGYDNDNLMVKGLNLNESQIEEMWSQGLIYPANGYKYNEVTREE